MYFIVNLSDVLITYLGLKPLVGARFVW